MVSGSGGASRLHGSNRLARALQMKDGVEGTEYNPWWYSSLAIQTLLAAIGIFSARSKENDTGLERLTSGCNVPTVLRNQSRLIHIYVQQRTSSHGLTGCDGRYIVALLSGF